MTKKTSKQSPKRPARRKPDPPTELNPAQYPPLIPAVVFVLTLVYMVTKLAINQGGTDALQESWGLSDELMSGVGPALHFIVMAIFLFVIYYAIDAIAVNATTKENFLRFKPTAVGLWLAGFAGAFFGLFVWVFLFVGGFSYELMGSIILQSLVEPLEEVLVAVVTLYKNKFIAVD